MKKVQKGDNLEVKASTWNNFIDAANYVKNVQSNQHANTIEGGLSNGIVWVKNSENGTFPQFSALVLSDILIKPSQNELEFKNSVPVFTGSAMSEDLENWPYGILLEPIESQKIGRALLMGVTPAKVSILDSEHQYVVPTANSSNGALESSASGVARILWKAGDSGEQWCMIQLGGASSGGESDEVVLCEVISSTSANGYNVNVYGNGIDEDVTETGILFAVELALNSEIPSGSLILGHRTFLTTTGGNEE